MREKKKWVNDFENLYPEQQLEVAEAIVNFFEKHPYTFLPNDRARVNNASIILKILLAIASSQKSVSGDGTVLERFEKLSPENKDAAIGRILEVIASYAAAQDLEERKRICETSGRHVFGEWFKKSWTTTEPVWDAGLQGSVKVPHQEWRRVCTRCGYKETSKKEPQELIDARKEAARQKKIGQLQRRLDRLKREEPK